MHRGNYGPEKGAFNKSWKGRCQPLRGPVRRGGTGGFDPSRPCGERHRCHRRVVRRWGVAPVNPRRLSPMAGEIAIPILGMVRYRTMERPMHILQERPWPAIDLAELRFGIAFGSSAEELADFLQRDVEEVYRKWAAEVQRSATRV